MKKLTHRLTISFEPETVDKIRDLKERFGMGCSDVIRECVEFDLPKLINRHTQAKKRGQGRYKYLNKTSHSKDSGK